MSTLELRYLSGIQHFIARNQPADQITGNSDNQFYVAKLNIFQTTGKLFGKRLRALSDRAHDYYGIRVIELFGDSLDHSFNCGIAIGRLFFQC